MTSRYSVFVVDFFLRFIVTDVFTEILEGGVQIIQNKFLNYAVQINWLDIVKDSGAEVIIEDNGDKCKKM